MILLRYSPTFPPRLLFYALIPGCILPKSYDYTSNVIISTINIGNKTLDVKIETLDGKVGFSNGIDVIVGVEINFADVEVDEPVVAPIDSVAEPAVDKQPDGRLYKFVRMDSTDFTLSDNVSRMAKLDSDLKHITARLLHLTQQEEFTNHNEKLKF
ncbi:hypothetical protein Hanom_Chr08g00732261 [Helianthus anomalus]